MGESQGAGVSWDGDRWDRERVGQERWDETGGTGQGGEGGTGWDQEGQRGQDWMGQSPTAAELCRTERGQGWDGKGWDSGARTCWGTVQPPPTCCPQPEGTFPAHTGPRVPREEPGRNRGSHGAGREQGHRRDPGTGHCASQQCWLSRTPTLGTPSWSWVPLSSAPRRWPRAGCCPLCRVSVRPRTLPAHTALTHKHTLTHVQACAGAPVLGGMGQGTGVSSAGDTPLCPRSAGGGPRQPCSSSSPNTRHQVSGTGTDPARGDTGQTWTWRQGTSGPETGGGGRDGTWCDDKMG